MMWTAAGVVFLMLAAVSAVASARPRVDSGVVLLQMAAGHATLAALCIAVGAGPAYLVDVAVLVAVAGAPSALVLGHFLERWR